MNALRIKTLSSALIGLVILAGTLTIQTAYATVMADTAQKAEPLPAMPPTCSMTDCLKQEPMKRALIRKHSRVLPSFIH